MWAPLQREREIAGGGDSLGTVREREGGRPGERGRRGGGRDAGASEGGRPGERGRKGGRERDGGRPGERGR